MATKKQSRPFRLKIVDGSNTTYLVRYQNGNLSYMNGKETPLALSNLLNETAAEVRFQLQDTMGGTSAKQVLDRALAQLWARNPVGQPKVTLLP